MVDHSQKGSPVEVCETEQQFGHLDEEIHTPVDRMQKGKSINLCETDEELGDENVSETDNSESDVDDIENNQDGNIIVDEENIFDEPDVEFDMFKLIDEVPIPSIGSSSQIPDDFFKKNEIQELLTDADFASGSENEVEYVIRKKKMRAYKKQKLIEAQQEDEEVFFSVVKPL